MTDKLIHIATITQPHGLKGQFKLNCFLESPENLTHLSQFFDEQSRVLDLELVSIKSKMPIAALEGVTDRNGAEALKQMKIFACKSDFPEIDEGEFYSHQLIGLEVRKPDGQVIGEVLAHHNFGAGDILEVTFNNGQSEMMPFTDDVFPELNIEEGYVSFVPPEYME